MTIGVMLLTSTTALADPLSTQLNGQQQQLEQNRDTYDDIQNQIEDASASIQKFDDQIQDMMDDIDATQKQIAKTQADIKNTENEIQKSTEELNIEQESFDERVQAIYRSGEFSYIGILLGSKSLTDFLGRVEIVSRIIKYDNGIMDGLKAERQKIANEKEALKKKNDSLVALDKQNKDKLAELNAKKSEQVVLANQLRDKEKLYASKIQESQELVNATLKQIQAMKEAAKKQAAKNKPTDMTSRGSSYIRPNASGNDLVVYASNFLGVPYVWGGNTPSGFDCSGFTKYVFAHFGISLARRASQQAKQGVAVSKDNLQPGDLVFFGNPVYHVGIYVGNGCFIHAPQTGDVVKIAPLRWMNFSYARRVR